MTNHLNLSPTATPIAYPTSLMADLRDLDLTPIKYKLMAEKGWTAARADSVELAYKAFLSIIMHKGQDNLVPSLDIDDMWHTHILDTQKYIADCARFFGEYIHHYPYFGQKDEHEKIRAQELFTLTRTKIKNELGISLTELNFANCGSSCSSSSCSSSSCSTSSCSTPDTGGSTGDIGDIISIISSCSGSSISDDKPRNRNPRPTKPSKPPEGKRRGIIGRILGLSPTTDPLRWYASVSPKTFRATDYRPTMLQINELTPNKPVIH